MPTPTSKMPEKVDSKFRFVLVAARRAEQLLQGARIRLESPEGKKHTRIAQEEVRTDLIAWDYGADADEEAAVVEETVEEASAEAEDEVH